MLHTIMRAIELSELAYKEFNEVEHTLKGMNIKKDQWIENKYTDTQVFICEDDANIWVVFRGTEFDSFNDWITNLDCAFTDIPSDKLFTCNPWGKVHRGFWKDVYSVKDYIYKELTTRMIAGPVKKLIITGHSQGAACAELLFSDLYYRMRKKEMFCIPIEAPRSMSKEAAHNFGTRAGSKIYRVINNNDIVPRVPTRLMGYRHVYGANLNYLDYRGNLHHDLSWWEKFKDRVKGRVYDFGKAGTDGIKDHSISEIKRIWKNLIF